MATSGFGGTIESVQLPDAIQLICMSGRTAALTVSVNLKRGTLFFQDGNIVHAEYSDLIGEDAFFEIISWKGGEFALAALSPGHERTITDSWQGLLLEVARRNDEHNMNEEQNMHQEETAHDDSNLPIEDNDLTYDDESKDEAENSEVDLFDFGQNEDSTDNIDDASTDRQDDQSPEIESSDSPSNPFGEDKPDIEEGAPDAFGAFDQLEEEFEQSSSPEFIDTIDQDISSDDSEEPDNLEFDDEITSFESSDENADLDERSDPFDTLQDTPPVDEMIDEDQPQVMEGVDVEIEEPAEPIDSLLETQLVDEMVEEDQPQVEEDIEFEIEESTDPTPNITSPMESDITETPESQAVEANKPEPELSDFVTTNKYSSEPESTESIGESVIGSALDKVVHHYMQTWPSGTDQIRFDKITTDLLPDHIYRHFLCRFLQLAMQVIHLDDMPFDFSSKELSNAVSSMYEVLRNNWIISHDQYKQIIYDANYFDLTRAIDPARAISQFLYERTENDSDQMIPFLKAMVQNELINKHYEELSKDLKLQEDHFIHPRKVENFIRSILDRRSFSESYKAVRNAMQHLLDIVGIGTEKSAQPTKLIKITVVMTMLESRGLVNVSDFLRVEQKIGKESLSIVELDGLVERYLQYANRIPSRRRRELSGQINSEQSDVISNQHDAILSLNKDN